MEDNFDGNDQAPAEGQVDSSPSDNKVNPGAIRKSTTHSILNALSAASGQQFESVEAAIAYMARTSAQKTSVGNEQPAPVVSNRQSAKDKSSDLHEQFARLQQDLARKDQALRERDLDRDIMQVMGDRFDADLTEFAMQKVRTNIRWNDDGTYSIVNSKGQERYGMDGQPLTISGLVEEIAKGNPKLLKNQGLASGSGLRPGNIQYSGDMGEAIPDYSRDPAAFNAWAQRNGLGKNIGLKKAGVSASVSVTGKKVL